MSGFMNTNDAPSSKLATLYCTVGGRRYAMLNAKNFEAKANVSLADVPILGKTIKGKKPSGLEIKIKMTICNHSGKPKIAATKATKLPKANQMDTSCGVNASIIANTTKAIPHTIKYVTIKKPL